MSDQPATPDEFRQGPEDPDRPGGPDAQPAPRTPVRTDTPEQVMDPIPGAKDPGPQVQRVTRDDTPDPPPVTGADEHQGDAARARQEQNAETSADQPSA
ncbi:hypothetical protein [Nocardioides ferulae]|uniref:hypothetical protein n=1 Tax=Nocardioides ferulae TaxID=2340821 RepID=UPI000EB00EA4|nr:hypothetical protein [Nocardioides ferulae]